MKAFKYLFFVLSLVYLLYSFFTTDCAVTYEDKYTYNYERDSVRWSTIMMYSDPEYKEWYLYTPFCDLSLNGKTYEQIIDIYGLPPGYEKDDGYGTYFWTFHRGVEFSDIDQANPLEGKDVLFRVPFQTKVSFPITWPLDSLRELHVTFIKDDRGLRRCRYAFIINGNAYGE